MDLEIGCNMSLKKGCIEIKLKRDKIMDLNFTNCLNIFSNYYFTSSVPEAYQSQE